jgi:hypothetical protein
LLQPVGVGPETQKVSYKVNNTVMVIGTADNLFFTQRAAGPGVPNWFNLRAVVGTVYTAVHISKDGKNIYAATAGGKILRVSGIDLFNKSYAYVSGGKDAWNNQGIIVEDLGVQYNSAITSLATDWAEGQNLVVTTSSFGVISQYVTRIDSCKSGTLPRTKIDISNNLPQMPINSAVYLPSDKVGSTGKNRIVLGTMSGIWGSDNNGASWVELNEMGTDPTKWHPRVPTARVRVQQLTGYSGTVLYTATHGRGMFCSKSMATKWPTKISEVTKNTSLNVYPNPATDNVVIDFNAASSTTAAIQVLSNNGRIMYQTSAHLDQGGNKVNLNTSNFAPGFYIISMVVNGERVSKTFIKQ